MVNGHFILLIDRFSNCGNGVATIGAVAGPFSTSLVEALAVGGVGVAVAVGVGVDVGVGSDEVKVAVSVMGPPIVIDAGLVVPE
jgi:hypothetical protein